MSTANKEAPTKVYLRLHLRCRGYHGSAGCRPHVLSTWLALPGLHLLPGPLSRTLSSVCQCSMYSYTRTVWLRDGAPLRSRTAAFESAALHCKSKGVGIWLLSFRVDFSPADRVRRAIGTKYVEGRFS